MNGYTLILAAFLPIGGSLGYAFLIRSGGEANALAHAITVDLAVTVHLMRKPASTGRVAPVM